jgi:hypothetical protein
MSQIQEILQCGSIHPMVRENNCVKCVFWDEKDSIFALDLLRIKVGNTQEVHQTRHCGNGAIFKRDLLHQIPYVVLVPDP